MNGELHWADVVDYFGADLNIHRTPLSKAGWSTYGLLACRFVANDRLSEVNGKGEHAEEKLIRSALWNIDLDAALRSWSPRDQAMLVLMALNRSPCGDCAHLLASALHKFNDKYALTTEKQHFVLASLGYYHSNKEDPDEKRKHPRTFSTGKGTLELKEAGWKLCTLSFDPGLTRRGRQWKDYLTMLR